MKTFIIIFIAVTKIVLSPFVTPAQTNDQSILTSDKYVILDGKKMHYQAGGTGAATVVFENGHGDDLSEWNSVFSEVAKFAKVIRYDREGYGLSEYYTQPQTFKQIATRLHELLQKANIRPPYVLVGHSMGGALIRAFAFMYPNEITGLVFVDPFNEYVGSELTKEQKTEAATSMDSSIKKDSIMMEKGSTTYAAEFKIMRGEFLNGFPELNSFGALPDVPMALFAAGKNRPPGWENSVKELFANKMHELSETRFIEIPQSPHYIQDYEPSLVIENIRRIVFPDAENILRKTLRANGADSCIAQYKKMRDIYPKEYMLERFLNTLGYEELNDGHLQEAIKLFAVNVAFYPKSSNVYDSLGEAYMDAGNKKEAIKNYERSLVLIPANTNAVKMLEKLK
jgi:pimeloyl-ACP methyl ester carboxylesterase